jgi:ABC-type hemin transport system substrate-binding protein
MLGAAGCERAGQAPQQALGPAPEYQQVQPQVHQQAQPSAEPARANLARVAMLSPAGAVMLRDLGLGDVIVARHAFDAASSPGLPSVGDQAGIDYEALLATRPTHVVTQWGARELPERLQALARSGGMQLHDMNPVSLQDVRQELAALQAQLGTPATAPRAAELDAQLASMLEAADAVSSSQAEGASDVRRVVLLLSASPIAVLGPTSCQAQAARAAGFVVVPQSGPAYAELSGEEFVALGAQAAVLFAPVGAGVATDEAGEAKAARGDSAQAKQLAARATAALHAAGFRASESEGELPMLVVQDVESLLPSTSMVRLHGMMQAWRLGLANERDDAKTGKAPAAEKAPSAGPSGGT